MSTVSLCSRVRWAVAHDFSPMVRQQAMEALLKTDQPRTAIVAILAILPKLATENPHAYLDLKDALPYLRRQARGRKVGEA